MHESAESCGRNAESLELSLGGSLSLTSMDSLEEATALGAQRMVLSPSQSTDLLEVCDEMSSFAERVGLRPRN
ncbi:MAG: hypothetical protein WD029_02365 [Microthrixaceae bacterium]